MCVAPSLTLRLLAHSRAETRPDRLDHHKQFQLQHRSQNHEIWPKSYPHHLRADVRTTPTLCAGHGRTGRPASKREPPRRIAKCSQSKGQAATKARCWQQPGAPRPPSWEGQHLLFVPKRTKRACAEPDFAPTTNTRAHPRMLTQQDANAPWVVHGLAQHLRRLPSDLPHLVDSTDFAQHREQCRLRLWRLRTVRHLMAPQGDLQRMPTQSGVFGKCDQFVGWLQAGCRISLRLAMHIFTTRGEVR